MTYQVICRHVPRSVDHWSGLMLHCGVQRLYGVFGNATAVKKEGFTLFSYSVLRRSVGDGRWWYNLGVLWCTRTREGSNIATWSVWKFANRCFHWTADNNIISYCDKKRLLVLKAVICAHPMTNREWRVGFLSPNSRGKGQVSILLSLRPSHKGVEIFCTGLPLLQHCQSVAVCLFNAGCVKRYQVVVRHISVVWFIFRSSVLYLFNFHRGHSLSEPRDAW